MGLVGYAKLRVADNEAMENIRVVDKKYWSSIIGILTVSTKCNVFRYVKVLLKSHMNQDFAGKMFYQLAQESSPCHFPSVSYSTKHIQYRSI